MFEPPKIAWLECTGNIELDDMKIALTVIQKHAKETSKFILFPNLGCWKLIKTYRNCWQAITNLQSLQSLMYTLNEINLHK